MKKQIAVIALILVLLTGLLSGCGGTLPSVNVQSVAELTGVGAVGEFNTSAGVVVAQNEIKIERDESRKVAQLYVQAGDEVTQGQVLFEYDTEEMQLAIDKAELEIEQLKNSITDYAAQITQLEKEKASAPASEQLSYTVQIQSMQADKKEAEYNVTVKERELETLKLTAQSGAVTSPINGKVQSVNEDGGYDDYTGQLLPYMTLMESGAYRVKGTVNELNRGDVYEGMQVLIRSRADKAVTWTGTVTVVDLDNPESGNSMNYYGTSDSSVDSSRYPFYIELDSTEGIMLGQHVYIEPNNGQDEAQSGLWLDASFVSGEEGNYWVWADNGKNKIEKREVTVASYDEMLFCYEIIDGLTTQDYIAYPEDGIQEGAPTVRIDTSAGDVDGGDYIDDMIDGYDSDIVAEDGYAG